MKQILIELDEATMERLEAVAPGKTRKRSAFIRTAIQRALDDMAEAEMAAAYGRQPDDAREVYLDPAAWEPAPPRLGSRRGVAVLTARETEPDYASRSSPGRARGSKSRKRS